MQEINGYLLMLQQAAAAAFTTVNPECLFVMAGAGEWSSHASSSAACSQASVHDAPAATGISSDQPGQPAEPQGSSSTPCSQRPATGSAWRGPWVHLGRACI